MKDRTPLPRLAARPRSAESPASMAQVPWLEPDHLPAHEQWLPVVWRLEGPLDVRAFLAAFQETVDRHEILRTRYVRVGKAWRQVVGSPGEVVLRPIDMTDVDASNGELLIWERLKVIYDAPVSPEHGAVRLEFFKVGSRQYLLAGFIHHVAIDNVSLAVLFGELMDIYMRRASGADPKPLPKFQYADFSLWEAEWLKNGGRAEAAGYWKKALARAKPFRLPGSRGRRGPQSLAIGQNFTISKDVLAATRKCAADFNSTTPAMFYAALSLALAKWAGSDQVLLGAFTHGRPAGFGETMGCFTQLRPFFLDLGGNPRVRAVLERACAAAIAVSDFRRPIETGQLNDLDVGGVLVNYVRRSGSQGVRTLRSAGSAVAVSLVSPMKEPVTALAASPGTGLSVSQSEIGSHADIGPWQRMPSFSSSASLGTLSKNGTEAGHFGLRAGMSRLPRLLQPYFSRDLHVGVLEIDSELSIYATVGEGGLDAGRVAAIMADVSSYMAAFATVGDRKVSDLLK